jgi:hypothetical protein
MGFIKEVYSNNRAGLVVAFGRPNSNNFINTDNVQEAMNYFNMYLKDGNLYVHSEDEIALDNLGVTAQEATEVRGVINTFLATVPDEEVESVKILFPQWKAGIHYETNTRVRFDGNVYKVLQAHTSQEDWMPDVAVSLYAPLLIDEETNKILEWVQPDSTNPYMIGDRVIFEEKVYESLIDNNVWSPVDYPAGWQEITEE